MAKVCVIVFTCDRGEDLRRCLISLVEQSYTDIELLVIDNGDSQETVEVLKEFPVRIIKDRTKRLPYLFNLGWRNTDKEILAYLADDAQLQPDWIEEGIAGFNRHPGAAVITGPFVSPHEFTGEMHALYTQANCNPYLRLAAKFYDRFILEGKTFQPCILCESGSYTLGQGFKPDFTEDREVDLATSSCMLIKRSAIEAVGGFDENFYFNHADGDLFIRLKKMGFQIVYNPKMCAIHYVRLGSSRYPFFIGRDTAYFYLKDIWPKTPRGVFAALANIVILNFYWVYKTAYLRDLGQLLGIYGFIKGGFDYIKSVRKTKK